MADNPNQKFIEKFSMAGTFLPMGATSFSRYTSIAEYPGMTRYLMANYPLDSKIYNLYTKEYLHGNDLPVVGSDERPEEAGNNVASFWDAEDSDEQPEETSNRRRFSDVGEGNDEPRENDDDRQFPEEENDDAVPCVAEPGFRDSGHSWVGSPPEAYEGIPNPPVVEQAVSRRTIVIEPSPFVPNVFASLEEMLINTLSHDPPDVVGASSRRNGCCWSRVMASPHSNIVNIELTVPSDVLGGYTTVYRKVVLPDRPGMMLPAAVCALFLHGKPFGLWTHGYGHQYSLYEPTNYFDDRFLFKLRWGTLNLGPYADDIAMYICDVICDMIRVTPRSYNLSFRPAEENVEYVRAMTEEWGGSSKWLCL